MYFRNILLIIFGLLRLATSSPSCVDVTHSECDIDYSLLDELTTQNKAACQLICTALGEVCHFSVFDTKSFVRGNCRLYDSPLSGFIRQCNELSGPQELPNDCDLENPQDNTCQIFRSGKCQFGRVQETEYFGSWQNCHEFCVSNSQCQLWRFEMEEGLCKLLYSTESYCTWEISPREPSFDKCDDDTSCHVPMAEEHGYWFCLPSNDPTTLTCNLECDPGYVSDGRTVNICDMGEWSLNPTPTCVGAVALITGGSPDYTAVEVYDANGFQKKLPDLPEHRNGHTLDLVNSFVLLCGGWTTIHTSCLFFGPSQEWAPHSTTTSLRMIHVSVSMLGKLHLMGGFGSGHGPLVTTEYLNTSTHQWHQSWNLEESYYDSCGVKVQPEMMIMTGGRDPDDAGAGYKSVWSYNVTNGAATRLQDLITKRYSHGCVYAKQPGTGTGVVLVAGGMEYEKNATSSCEMYDMTTGQWSTTGYMNDGKMYFRMTVLGEYILAMGGSCEQNGCDGVQDSVESFNMTSRQWTRVMPMLYRRSAHAVAAVPPNAVRLSLV